MADEDFHTRATQPGGFDKSPTSAPSDHPKEIAGFEILEHLDTGGMSHIYRAKHPQIEEEIVVKVLATRFLKNDEVVGRFLKEASIIALADHPNIVKLYRWGQWEGGLYIAMEAIEGTSLHSLIESGQIRYPQCLKLVLETAYALCHLHTHSIIHRDLKLENILVTKEGQVKVIDFGVSQLLREQKASSKRGKQIIGTPIYMSPEQYETPDLVSYPSDIYSLGIVAYEMITGKVLKGPLDLHQVPEALRPILSRCLKRLPEERYQDVVDFIADLSEVVNQL